MTGYSIQLGYHPIRKRPIAIVKFSGDCTIDTSGWVVDENLLEQVRAAANEYNAVSEFSYPADATGAQIAEIDKMLDDKATNLRMLANKLAATAKKQ